MLSKFACLIIQEITKSYFLFYIVIQNCRRVFGDVRVCNFVKLSVMLCIRYLSFVKLYFYLRGLCARERSRASLPLLVLRKCGKDSPYTI